MLESLATEIRSFYSLRDLKESIEEEIEKYEVVADEYSQWLGSFLRDLESTPINEELLKKLSTFQKSMKGKSKGGPTKKLVTSTEWIFFRGIMLSASEQGEAEILFDAVEEINRKIEQLNRVKSAIEILERSALGKDVIYITYIRNGVPEKIVLRAKREKEFMEKFRFTADFSALKEVYP
jgi:hypothetical protein